MLQVQSFEQAVLHNYPEDEIVGEVSVAHREAVGSYVWKAALSELVSKIIVFLPKNILDLRIIFWFTIWSQEATVKCQARYDYKIIRKGGQISTSSLYRNAPCGSGLT